MNTIYVSYTSALHFLIVAKHMNMSKAAQELFISPAALSQSISKLESTLSVTLFYRVKGKLILSSNAEALLPYFEKFRTSHDELVAEAVSLSSPQNNPVNIGYSGSAYTFSVLYFSNAISESQNRNIRLSFITDSMALDLLLSKQLDFAISTVNIAHPLISSIKLAEENIGVALPLGHPMADREFLKPSDLPLLEFYGLSSSHAFRQMCDEICRSLQIEIHYISDDSYETYRQRFSNPDPNNGCFLSARQNFNINLEHLKKYVFKEIKNDLFNMKTTIYFLSDDKKHYQYQELIQQIKEALSYSTLLNNKFSSLVHNEFHSEERNSSF